MVKDPVRVAVTGAAGNIGYQLLFRIASGSMLGPDQPVILQMLEIPPAQDALRGVAMELSDSAFKLVHGLITTDDPKVAFKDADIAVLVGAKPRGPGMERADLLEANGAIFTEQGKALNEVASRDVKVVVVGNPANTNALIAMNNAPDLPRENFTALTRLDHNRALSQLAEKTGKHITTMSKMTIWGNHSLSQYPDISHAIIDGVPAGEAVNDQTWVVEEFMPKVQRRGAEIISVRGASSAASAASSAVDHMHDWFAGTPEGDWVSMAVPSDGSYGVPEGLISSFPVTCADGKWTIVPDLEIDEFSRGLIDATAAELGEERDAVRGLGLIE